MRKHEAGDRREGGAERRAEKERGREDSARGAAAEADRGGEKLQAEQQREESRRGHLVIED